MSKLLIALALATSSTAFAALPPLAQSQREIRAILDAPETYHLLGGAEPIEQIVHTDNSYTVITAHQKLMVDIEYQRSGKIGPAEFKLHFH